MTLLCVKRLRLSDCCVTMAKRGKHPGQDISPITASGYRDANLCSRCRTWNNELLDIHTTPHASMTLNNKDFVQLAMIALCCEEVEGSRKCTHSILVL